jgi:NMT1-like family
MLTGSIHQLGFVPSLEGMPLVEALGAEPGWQLLARPGYGNIIRNLLTGDLQAGLVPWELFITELLLQPGQAEAWAVVQVIQAMPVELVLGAAARKRLYPAKSGAAGAGSTRLSFAIESKQSLAKLQFHSWFSRFPAELSGKPLLRVLPMEFMLKGLEENAIDGMIAPTPWGLQAEAMGVGKLDPDFKVEGLSQQVVLICRRDCLAGGEGFFSRLPSRTTLARERLADDPGLFSTTVQRMELPSLRRPSLAVFQKAATSYPWPAGLPDFIPDEEWLAAGLWNLATLMPVPSGMENVRALAAQLVFPISQPKGDQRRDFPTDRGTLPQPMKAEHPPAKKRKDSGPAGGRDSSAHAGVHG